MRQKSLFSQLEPIEADQRRAEPVVWVRQLVILSEPSESAIIREIPFHRGLNIIRTEKRQPHETCSVAHDVGKTLLMRLLRFTLGEDWYASKDDTARICKALPYGMVAAEWMVADEPWTIVRPLSDKNSIPSYAVRGRDWKFALEARETEQFSLDVFVQRIEEAAFSELPILEVKGGKVGWRDVLAWIARDCSCGFRKTDTWRDREVNPKGARETKYNKLIMQWLMGLMSEMDASARISRDAGKKELKNADRKAVAKQERLQALFDSLARSAEFSIPQVYEESDPPILSDLAAELRSFVRNNAATASWALTTFQRSSNQELETLRLQIVRLEDQSNAAIRDAGEWRTHHRMLVTQYNDEQKRESGPKQCPAKEQCAWLVEIQKNETAGRMDSQDLHMNRLKEQIEEALSKSNAATAKEERLIEQLKMAQERYFDREAEIARQRAELQLEVGRWSTLAVNLDELSEAIDDFLSAQEEVESIREGISQNNTLLSREIEDSNRQDSQRKLQDYYTHILMHIFDDDAKGILDIEDGLKPKTAASLQAHGTALSAMARVISFELSCLLASMCGQGSHPRLLMHDGPREGEMEPELFRILFKTVSWLESISHDADAAFQYIITTADAPEDFNESHPAVALTLHGREDNNGLLLKKRF